MARSLYTRRYDETAPDWAQCLINSTGHLPRTSMKHIVRMWLAQAISGQSDNDT